MLSCNHKPATRDDSFGFWRRVHVVPFERRFDAASRDPELVTTLKAEGSGNLLIAVRTSFRVEVSRTGAGAFERLQVAVRSYMCADVQVAHPEAFVVLS